MGIEDGAPVVLEGEPGPPDDGVPAGRVLERVKVELTVGPWVAVELEMGKAQLVVVAVVVVVRPGQLLAVGLHWVIVTVWVRVWVEVVVMSASWAATSERPVARTAMMLLNCMMSDLRPKLADLVWVVCVDGDGG